MDLLLDSQVVIWAVGEFSKLRPAIRELLVSPNNRLFLSAASLWEIQIKVMKGRLTIPETFDSEIETLGIEQLPVTWNHAHAIRRLDPIHRDPFDRMLVAQALTENLHLVTADSDILRYPVPTIQA